MREGWVRTTIGDVAEVVGGSTPSTREPAYWGGPIPWITPSEVTRQEGQIIKQTDRTITDKGLKAINGRLVPSGTVLLTSRATVGAVALAGAEMATNQGFAALIAGDLVNAHWLMLWCQAHRPDFEALAGGSTFPEIGKPAVRAVSIDLPPLREQRRVVDVLTACDDAAAAANGVRDLARRSRLAFLESALADAIAAGAPVLPLDVLAEVRLGFTKGARSGHLIRVPYLRAANLTFGTLRLDDVADIDVDMREVDRHALQPGDVLMTEGGNPWDLGRGWLWEGELSVCIHQNSVVRATAFRSDVNPRFVAHLLESHALRAYFESRSAQTSGVAHLGKKGAAQAPIILPDMATQQQIVSALDALRDTERAASSEFVALRYLRASLLTDLLARGGLIPESYDRFLDGAE